jgi:amidohydrolase
MHPECGMEERRTAAIVAAHLRQLGYEVQTGVGGTGVVGLLNPGKPGKVVALRADMDALPIQDAKQVPYASEVPGKMHACGHDGHTAILMGAAILLARHREELPGQVKLLFQPAEEGPGGAKPMIEAGALEGPRPDACFALHLWSDLPVGSAAIRPGPHMAASDSITMTIRGVGGHGAYPHSGIDAIAVAGQVITALQNIVSRETDPLEAAVVTLGTIQGGFRGNVIAPEVRMTGTVRSLSPDVRGAMEGKIRRVFEGTCQMLRATPALEYSYGYPVASNDPAMAALMAAAASEVLGDGRVSVDAKPVMGAEDFAYIAELVPSAYMRLGSMNPAKGITAQAHNPNYDIDEDALPLGAAVVAHAAWRFLAEGGR